MDYCTRFLEGWWSECCRLHDLDYLNQVQRSVADFGLLKCVVASGYDPVTTAASVVIGAGMYSMVRLFGKRYFKNAATK